MVEYPITFIKSILVNVSKIRIFWHMWMKGCEKLEEKFRKFYAKLLFLGSYNHTTISALISFLKPWSIYYNSVNSQQRWSLKPIQCCKCIKISWNWPKLRCTIYVVMPLYGFNDCLVNALPVCNKNSTRLDYFQIVIWKIVTHLTWDISTQVLALPTRLESSFLVLLLQ